MDMEKIFFLVLFGVPVFMLIYSNLFNRWEWKQIFKLHGLDDDEDKNQNENEEKK